MKSPIFLVIGDFYVIFGDFLVRTGEPPPYCNKIPTFMGSSKANFEKKLGLGQIGQIPNFYRKFVSGAPLNTKHKQSNSVQKLSPTQGFLVCVGGDSGDASLLELSNSLVTCTKAEKVCPANSYTYSYQCMGLRPWKPALNGFQIHTVSLGASMCY